MVSIIHDTLYIPQLASIQTKRTDTVVVYKYINGSKNTANTYLESKIEIQKKENSINEVEITVPLIRTMSPETIIANSKMIKNKSIKEDSLAQKIGYASI